MTSFTKQVPDAASPISHSLTAVQAVLNLSRRELADKLGTSLYALTRWERGDIAPSADVLSRLDALQNPAATSQDNRQCPPVVTFASSGSRAQIDSLPLFHGSDIGMLDTPRASILEDICSNSLWGDSDLALGDILQRRSEPAPTRDAPLEEEISAGKNTYTYDAHTYHTKVPPQGIASIIAKYLPEGGVVLDPFSGSGMTGVAARYLGCDGIMNELSPAASFISHNFLKTVDTDEFNSAISKIMGNLEDLRRNLYSTTCRECGKKRRATLHGLVVRIGM